MRLSGISAYSKVDGASMGMNPGTLRPSRTAPTHLIISTPQASHAPCQVWEMSRTMYAGGTSPSMIHKSESISARTGVGRK